MASGKDIVAGQLAVGQYLIEKFTGDLTDEEFFTAPVSGANHAGWVLGHIAVSEDSLCAVATGSDKRIPEATQKLFGGESECSNERSKYPSRKEIEELYRRTRAHTLEALKSFDEGKWDDPSPEGWPKEVFPTLGSMWSMQGTHLFWHIGQITVCRQALKKKRVLGGSD